MATRASLLRSLYRRVHPDLFHHISSIFSGFTKNAEIISKLHCPRVSSSPQGSI